MALTFQYDLNKVVKFRQKYVLDHKTVTRLKDTLAAKKIPPAHVTKFVRDLAAHDSAIEKAAYEPLLAFRAGAAKVQGKLGADLNPKNAAQVWLEDTATFAKFQVFSRKFDLSVHLKGANLELQHTDVKGVTHVVFTTKP